jgi:hypothetical protein
MVTLPQLVSAINDLLDGPWAKRELTDGKRIAFPIEQVGHQMMYDVSNTFKEVGWTVDRVVELSSPGTRSYYLNFINPSWKTKQPKLHRLSA